MSRRLAGTGSREEGSILLLTFGLVAVALLLVAVVVDASRLYLAQQALSDLADGAARAGAQAVDPAAVYRGTGETLRLDLPAAATEVARYLAAVRPDQRPLDLRLVSVTVDPADAEALVVTLFARAPVPLLSLVTAQPAGVPVTVTARAHTVAAG
jgi:Flp pilus assembly protein TadG